MQGNAPDEERVDEHWECAAEIKRLKEALEAHNIETVDIEYEAAVSRLMRASTDAERRNIAREIFQLGQDHGYELCIDLSYED